MDEKYSVFIARLCMNPYTGKRSRMGINMDKQKISFSSNGGDSGNYPLMEHRGTEYGISPTGRITERENQPSGKMVRINFFWIRCILAICLFAAVVLADYNHVQYRGYSVSDIQNMLKDYTFVEKAESFLAKYMQ